MEHEEYETPECQDEVSKVVMLVSMSAAVGAGVAAHCVPQLRYTLNKENALQQDIHVIQQYQSAVSSGVLEERQKSLEKMQSNAVLVESVAVFAVGAFLSLRALQSAKAALWFTNLGLVSKTTRESLKQDVAERERRKLGL